MQSQSPLAELIYRGYHYDYSNGVQFPTWLDIAEQFLGNAINSLRNSDDASAYINLVRFVDLVMCQLPQHPSFYRIERYERLTWLEVPQAIKKIRKLHKSLARGYDATFIPPEPFHNLERNLDHNLERTNGHFSRHKRQSSGISVSSSGSQPIAIPESPRRPQFGYVYENPNIESPSDILITNNLQAHGYHSESYESPLTPQRITFAITNGSDHSLKELQDNNHKRRFSMQHWDDEIIQDMILGEHSSLLKSENTYNSIQPTPQPAEESANDPKWYYFYLC